MWAGTRQQRVKVTAKCQQRSTAWSAHCNVKQCHVSGRRTRLRVDTGTPRPLLLPATPPMGGPLRRTLSADNNAKTLVCALVTNRVDYCNGVLYHVVTWLPATHLRPLQSVSVIIISTSSTLIHVRLPGYLYIPSREQGQRRLVRAASPARHRRVGTVSAQH